MKWMKLSQTVFWPYILRYKSYEENSGKKGRLWICTEFKIGYNGILTKYMIQ
jgi:hypothetical protein